jgi:hypothetical protein
MSYENQPAAVEGKGEKAETKAPSGQWRKKVAASRRKREALVKTWKENVNFRKNKVFPSTDVDEAGDRIAVPVDWARTKAKTAQLFFQVPTIKCRARHPEFQPAAGIYSAALNFELEHEMKAYHMMDEVLGDVINASGIGVAMIGFEAEFEKVQVPAIDVSAYAPEQIAALEAQGGIPMEEVDRTVYQRYYTRRISPAQFLWPADFVGTDWQEAEWLGYEGRCTLAEALRKGWVDKDYEHECADKLETVNDDQDDDPESQSVGKYVKYCEIWYRKSAVDPKVKDRRAIGHLVLVEGKDKPIEKDFKWQAYDEESRMWGGLITYPIKVLTLTSVSDEAIPPSDSEIGRPQVRELNESRTQMILQRKHSAPMRWFDVNMVDEVVADQMEKGTYQGLIPMNGPGSNAIGEVARANYPRETFQFQQIIEKDLDGGWAMGPNQSGYASQGDTSAAEAKIMAGAVDNRLDYERARVLRFFLEIAEGTGALMQLFQDDEKWVEVEGPGGLKKLEAWNKTKVRGDFAFEAKPDAAVRVDVGQKRVESLEVYKLLRRDPMVNGGEILKNVLQWHGFDLTNSLAPPPEPPVKPAAIRYTFRGEDLTNPLVVAMVQKNTDTPVTPQDMDAAKKLMADAGLPSMPPQVMPVPQPGESGQLPSPEQIMKGSAQHPGPVEQVEPLNQRYGNGENPSGGGGV